MEVSDDLLCRNRDWDPSYLQQIFTQDFHDFSKMRSSNVNDYELVQESLTVEKYVPITEDISLDDSTLCSAIEQIEQE